MGLLTNIKANPGQHNAGGGRTSSVARKLRVEWVFWFAGAAGLVYCLTVGSRMMYARFVADKIVPIYEAGTTADPTGSEPPSGQTDTAGGTPTVVGRVEIPAVGLVTPLMSGDDSMSLAEGAGHIPGTAVPGGLGTVGIAGHRDTHFRLLGKVTPGMEVRLVSKAGVYHYRITSSEIVAPEQVSVLAIGDVPGLALVTCYPFRFIGHAPKRFIVHAELISVAPDEAEK